MPRKSDEPETSTISSAVNVGSLDSLNPCCLLLVSICRLRRWKFASYLNKSQYNHSIPFPSLWQGMLHLWKLDVRTIPSETVSPCRRPPGGPHYLHLPARPNQCLEWYRHHRFGVRQNGYDTIGKPLHVPWSTREMKIASDGYWFRYLVLVLCPPYLKTLPGCERLHKQTRRCFSTLERVLHSHGRRLTSPTARSMLSTSWPVHKVCQPPISGHFMSNLIAEFPEADSGILFEPKSDVWIEPSAAVLQGLGEIPVVESDCGRDTLSFQSRDQILVVLDGNKCDELIRPT